MDTPLAHAFIETFANPQIESILDTGITPGKNQRYLILTLINAERICYIMESMIFVCLQYLIKFKNIKVIKFSSLDEG